MSATIGTNAQHETRPDIRPSISQMAARARRAVGLGQQGGFHDLLRRRAAHTKGRNFRHEVSAAAPGTRPALSVFVASRAKQFRTTYERFETSQSGVMPATPTLELDDIDQVFARLESGAPPPGLQDESAREDRLAELENTALFHQLAMAHAGPLRDFMHELAAGPARRHWLEIARPLVASLLSAIKAMDQATLVPAMSSLHAAIDLAARAPGSKIDGGARKALLSAYGRLVVELPCVFDL